MIDGLGLVGGVIQLPFLAVMCSVVRRALAAGAGGPFIWIAKISKTDVLLAVFASTLTYAATALNPPMTRQVPQWFPIVSAAVTLLILLKLNAGLGIHWAVSSAVSANQAMVLRRARIA